MPEALKRHIQIRYGRNMDPDEIERNMIRSTPEHRVGAIEHMQRQLENPDLSIRERSELLSLKARMTNTHLRMAKVYR